MWLEKCQLAFVTCSFIALKCQCHSGFNVEFDFVSEVITENSSPTITTNSLA